ncbi:hypothetical protein M409DRAFT_70106 [Zasmidium cellare ATCC 36951]|uniref:Phosphatidic acid phosphatase type 2/haloperoxidase domain-containing protein n=1 Tax=Zasmidium cellare ATCC 36951 TaxID=1080233 RepID=A0A6A6C6N6_ZASCE|nr:uncharacterized protein M409DRAFT_70106 [Zasmidium cellare ATCC 36951]KAF2161046.1 hypothetical protein M409DRAFT_70106 [Zasmidium cellare ATCC 36951]
MAMRLFKRRTNKPPTAGPEDRDVAEKKRRFNFSGSKILRDVWEWFKETWPDHFLLIEAALTTFAIYRAPPVARRTFQINYFNGVPIPPAGFDHQYRPYILNSFVSGAIALAAPILVFILMQIRVRSLRDLGNAIFGVQFSLATSALMHVVIASVVGGLRPNFYDVCKPKGKEEHGEGWEMEVLDRDACTGEDRMVDYAFSSFPSGHSTAAFAGFVFLFLYLNAKFKTFSNYRPPYWALVATWAPILAAIVIAGQCIVDHSHHWYDVLAGAFLGTLMAFSAYRMVYASIWDFRFNHIPLARFAPFQYDTESDSVKYDNLGKAMWTKDAGWGSKTERPWDGAPYDRAGADSRRGHSGHEHEAPSQVPVPDAGHMA